jgi:hypothetical protein
MYPTIDKILKIRKDGNKIYSLDIISSNSSDDIYVILKQNCKFFLGSIKTNDIASALVELESRCKLFIDQDPYFF